MKASNEELKNDKWDEPQKEVEDKQNIIDIRHLNVERITKPQYQISTYINIIKKSLCFENNDPSPKISRCGFNKHYHIDKEGGR